MIVSGEAFEDGDAFLERLDFRALAIDFGVGLRLADECLAPVAAAARADDAVLDRKSVV